MRIEDAAEIVEREVMIRLQHGQLSEGDVRQLFTSTLQHLMMENVA